MNYLFTVKDVLNIHEITCFLLFSKRSRYFKLVIYEIIEISTFESKKRAGKQMNSIYKRDSKWTVQTEARIIFKYFVIPIAHYEINSKIRIIRIFDELLQYSKYWNHSDFSIISISRSCWNLLWSFIQQM